MKPYKHYSEVSFPSQVHDVSQQMREGYNYLVALKSGAVYFGTLERKYSGIFFIGGVFQRFIPGAFMESAIESYQEFDKIGPSEWDWVWMRRVGLAEGFI